jgi:type IV fimbrial biogenesis protein FimT
VSAPLGPGARAHRRRGLTLIELVIVLAVLAVLGTLAVPSMARLLSRQRLVSAAQTLAADIADARHEAARRGSALHLRAMPGPQWCWSVATAVECPCDAAQAVPTCRLKVVAAKDHPGVSLLQSQALRMEPDGQAQEQALTAATFAAGDAQLRVEVSRLGRPRVCDPTGGVARVPRC